MFIDNFTTWIYTLSLHDALPISSGSVLRRGEGQRHGVHAVPVARRGLRGVGKHVAQVGVTRRAAHLGADHPQRRVLDVLDGAGLRRLIEARPTAVGVELGDGLEQRRAAALAGVGARPLLVQQLAGAGDLGAGVTQHVVLRRGEPLAPLLIAQRWCAETDCGGSSLATHTSIVRLLPRYR